MRLPLIAVLALLIAFTAMLPAEDQQLPKEALARVGRAVEGEKAPLRGMTFIPDKNQVILVTVEKEKVYLRTWDIEAGRVFVERVLEDNDRIRVDKDDNEENFTVSPGKELQGLIFSADSKRLATWTHDDSVVMADKDSNRPESNIHVWDVESGKRTTRFRHSGSDDGPRLAMFMPDDRTMLACNRDGANVWDHFKQKLEFNLHLVKDSEKIDGLAFAAQGKWGAVSFAQADAAQSGCEEKAKTDSTVRIISLEKRNIKDEIKEAGRVMAVSPDGKRFVTQSIQKELRVWKMDSGKKLLSVKKEAERVLFAPSSDRFLIQSADGVLRLFDCEFGEEMGQLKDAGRPLGFSADGRKLATTTDDATVLIWETKSLKKVK